MIIIKLEKEPRLSAKTQLRKDLIKMNSMYRELERAHGKSSNVKKEYLRLKPEYDNHKEICSKLDSKVNNYENKLVQLEKDFINMKKYVTVNFEKIPVEGVLEVTFSADSEYTIYFSVGFMSAEI